MARMTRGLQRLAVLVHRGAKLRDPPHLVRFGPAELIGHDGLRRGHEPRRPLRQHRLVALEVIHPRRVDRLGASRPKDLGRWNEQHLGLHDGQRTRPQFVGRDVIALGKPRSADRKFDLVAHLMNGSMSRGLAVLRGGIADPANPSNVVADPAELILKHGRCRHECGLTDRCLVAEISVAGWKLRS